MTNYEGFYKCKWPSCGCEFTANFGRIENIKGKSNGGGCSAVKCPKCGNNLKPMKDAVTIKEIDEKKSKGMIR